MKTLLEPDHRDKTGDALYDSGAQRITYILPIEGGGARY
jgi:hypothetical protein